MHSENEVVYLYLDDIIPNRFQPREFFDEKALQELSISIKEHGVIQPIIVRSIGDKYEIIAGERRYKASALAGLTRIPAIIRNLDDKESAKVALLENLQRKDLSAIEEARTYQKILELDQITQDELAKTMGKSQSAIANKLRLLSLPDEVQEAILKEQISERHARSLLNLKTPQEQIEFLHKIINNRMTVRELDNEIKGEVPQAMPSPMQPKFIDVTEEVEDQEEPALSDLDYLLKQSIQSQMENQHQMQENQKPIITPVEEPILEPIEEVPLIEDEIKPILPNIQSKEPTEVLTSPSEEIEVLSMNSFDLKSAINTIRSAVETIEQNGFVSRTEEMDFENMYQIVIRIDKNK